MVTIRLGLDNNSILPDLSNDRSTNCHSRSKRYSMRRMGIVCDEYQCHKKRYPSRSSHELTDQMKDRYLASEIDRRPQYRTSLGELMVLLSVATPYSIQKPENWHHSDSVSICQFHHMNPRPKPSVVLANQSSPSLDRHNLPMLSARSGLTLAQGPRISRVTLDIGSVESDSPAEFILKSCDLRDQRPSISPTDNRPTGDLAFDRHFNVGWTTVHLTSL
jgi:hypothetical protein